MNRMARIQALSTGVAAGATVVLLSTIPWRALPGAAAGSRAAIAAYWPAIELWLKATILFYVAFQIPLTGWRWVTYRMGLDIFEEDWSLPGRTACLRILGLAAWGALIVVAD